MWNALFTIFLGMILEAEFDTSKKYVGKQKVTKNFVHIEVKKDETYLVINVGMCITMLFIQTKVVLLSSNNVQGGLKGEG